MVEIESVEQLFDMLADDDSEVPSVLIRGGKPKVSKHELALEEQAELLTMNKVEEWMLSEGAVSSDPGAFVELGESLYFPLVNGFNNGLSVSIMQKLTKLNLVWLKVTKSARLVEKYVSEEHVIGLLSSLDRSWGRSSVYLDTCVRVIVAFLQSSANRLFVSELIIEWFNAYIQKWSRNKSRGNPQAFLHAFPLDFLTQLTWVPSGRPFTMNKIIESMTRLLKKKKNVVCNLNDFSKLATVKTQHTLVKFVGALIRTKPETQLPKKFTKWLQCIATENNNTAKIAKQILEM